jgi:hypothetical protein
VDLKKTIPENTIQTSYDRHSKKSITIRSFPNVDTETISCQCSLFETAKKSQSQTPTDTKREQQQEKLMHWHPPIPDKRKVKIKSKSWSKIILKNRPKTMLKNVKI